MTAEVHVRDEASGSGATCRRILSELPTWFGMEDANEHYFELAEKGPAVIASVEGEDVGITEVLHHSPYASEIFLMAVLPRFHRHGIGRKMLEHVEASLAAARVEFLQVKTLSSRRDDAGYAKTRAFYQAYGFRPLEEFPDLWHPSNPALQLIKTVPPAR